MQHHRVGRKSAQLVMLCNVNNRHISFKRYTSQGLFLTYFMVQSHPKKSEVGKETDVPKFSNRNSSIEISSAKQRCCIIYIHGRGCYACILILILKR